MSDARPAEAALAALELVALDVDGVLTDGRVVYQGEEELVSFHVHDGQAIRWLVDAGVHVAWITGRGCRATERRAAELGVQELHTRVSSKARCLASLRERLGVARDATLAMGDDLPDLGLREEAGLFACPVDAHAQVRAEADWVTERAGGHGAVREVVEALLRARGRWDGLVTRCRRRPE